MEFQVRYLALFLLFKWFWMESLHKNIQLMGEFFKAPFLVLCFSYYTSMTFLMMLFVILPSMLMILLSILSVIGYLICGKNLNWLLNLNLIYETRWTGVSSGLLISMLGKTQLVSFDRSNNNGSTDVKMGGSILEEKSSFKMLGLTFSSKLDWGFYIISIAKTASKKIGALLRSMKFLSPEVALYLYKSTILPCMEYCCHIWAGDPSCYLDLLDKLQKLTCRIVGPSLATSLEPLAHRQNAASVSLFYRHYFYNIIIFDVLQNWLNWFHFLFFEGGLLVILKDCMIFQSPFLDVTRMSMSTVSFLTQLKSGILCLQNAFL